MMKVTDIKKEVYEAPAIEVVEVNTEGIVCASEWKGTGHGYGGWD